MRTTNTSARTLWIAMTFGVALGFGVVLANDGFQATTEGAIRRVLLATAHVSFLLFLVPMVARPLHDLFPNPTTLALARKRPLFGLAFAGNQVWHAVFIAQLYRAVEGSPEPTSVLVGGLIGFSYLGAMTIFSFPGAIARIGPGRARLIHQLAFYYLVSVFFYDLVLRNLDAPRYLLASLYFGALGIRLAAWIMSRSSRSVRTSSA